MRSAVKASLRCAGAGRAVVGEPSAPRRRVAVEMGADVVLDPGADDVLSSSGGVEVAYDCAGHPSVIDVGVRAVRPGGRLVLAAQSPGDLTLPGAGSGTRRLR